MAPDSQEPYSPAGRKYIVGYEAKALDDLRAQLQSLGCKITFATSTPPQMHIAYQGSLDAAILEKRIAAMNGVRFLEQDKPISLDDRI